jgi:nanoRNase/pAp phosphatase (c-di-AMP/oligoRNAs hydrolase)
LLNSADWIKYSVILTQKWEYVKWSLRTLRDDIDLTDLAKKHGWWGHKKASGFTVRGNIEEFKSLNF